MQLKLLLGLTGSLVLSLLSACSSTALNNTNSAKSVDNSVFSSSNKVPFASTYKAPISEPYIVRNATIWTGTGDELAESDIVFSDGRQVIRFRE